MNNLPFLLFFWPIPQICVNYLIHDPKVEILSPSNTVEEIHNKLVEYFNNGSRLVWVIHPKEQYVLVYRSTQEPDRLLKSADSLDGEDIVPGFTLAVAELFQKLDFG